MRQPCFWNCLAFTSFQTQVITTKSAPNIMQTAKITLKVFPSIFCNFIFFATNQITDINGGRWCLTNIFAKKYLLLFFLLLFLFFSEIFHFLSSELGKDLRNGLWSQTCCRLIEFAPGRRKIVRKEWKMLGRKISIFNSWI